MSKVTTLTSTYDHRVIQGAQSGEFLKRMHELLIGHHGFYDEIFASLRIPYSPMRWSVDTSTAWLQDSPREARVFDLIQAYRTLGHLQADLDPLEYRQRSHPDLMLEHHGLSLWDLDRTFPVGNLAAPAAASTARCAASFPRSATPTVGRSASSTCTSPTRSSAAGSRTAWRPIRRSGARTNTCGSSTSSTKPRSLRPSSRRSSWVRSASAWKVASRRSSCWTSCARPPPTRAWTKS